MKYLKYVAVLAVLAMPLAYAQAAVNVGVGVGIGPVGIGVGVAGPPVCAYGYYPDYPYTCAPYGYYGPSWFANGVFIGAAPGITAGDIHTIRHADLWDMAMSDTVMWATVGWAR